MQQIRQTSVVDTKIEGNEVVITRNIEDVFDILPFLKFSNEDKVKIIGELNALLGRLSFSEAAQKNDIDFALQQAKPGNDFLISLFQNVNARKCLVNLIAYGKYIFDYKGDNKNELDYTNKFKENLKELQIILGVDIKTYLQAFSVSDADMHFLRVIPLACYEFASRELNLDDFRASELMGHNIAYKVADSDFQINKLVIKSPDGKQLESYSIRGVEIKKTLMTGEKVRDKALSCSILLPEYGENIPEEPVVIVAWTGTNNKETIRADFQTAAGEESYRCGEDQVSRQIVDHVQQFSELCHKPVKVVFTGHSLGGALAQLSYHSLQRVLAHSIEDPEIQVQVSGLEAKFNDELDKLSSSHFMLSLHQQSLHGIRLPTKYVSGMSVDVWSDADVLPPVENYSNDLSLLLTEHAKITQSGNFGRIRGDISFRRQGTILNKPGENGAKVRLLMVETDYTGLKTTLKGPGTGAVCGAIALPLMGLSFFAIVPGALIGAVIGTAVVVNAKWDAHSKKHFVNNQPLDSYQIYYSHHFDGTLNEDPETGYKKIQEELASKTSVVDQAISYASSFVQYSPRLHSQRKYHENRFNSSLRYAEKQDIEVGKGGYENVTSILVTEMDSGTLGANLRVARTVNEKNLINVQDKDGLTLLHHAVEKENNEMAAKLLSVTNVDINVQDNDGKTALHRAIEKENYELAEQILRIENIDVNLQDANGNTPILLLMANINVVHSKDKAYSVGIQLLAHEINLVFPNKKGDSVEKIFKTWNWSGVGMARTFCNALIQSLSEHQQPMKNLSTFFQPAKKIETDIASVYAAQTGDPLLYREVKRTTL